MVRNIAGTLAGLAGRTALWLMPMAVVFEWVGSTFEKTLLHRLLYLGLFLGLYWLTDLEPLPWRLEGRSRRALGLGLLLFGAGLATLAVRWLLAGRLEIEPWTPPPWMGEESYRLLFPVVAAYPLAIGSALAFAPAGSARALELVGLWVALAFLLLIAGSVSVQALPVLPFAPPRPWLLAGLAAVPLGLALVWRGPFPLRLGLLLLAGLTFRVTGLSVWAVDPNVRDMLALVTSAQNRFAAGQNPYGIHAMQLGSEVPLTYLPGLWLGYGIPRIFGLDLRLMGPALELALFSVMGFAARSIVGVRREWAEAFVMAFAAVWLFSPSVQWNTIYAEPMLWLALLGIALSLAYSGRDLAAALVLGYCLATRQFAIVVAPFVLLYLVRTRGLRSALLPIAGCGVVAAILLVPFVAMDPEQFWFGTFRWLREYGPAHLPWFLDRFGFVKYFADNGSLSLLPYVQGGVVALCFAAAAFDRRERIPAYGATAQLAFMTLNVLLWDSFFLDAAIAAAAVVLTRPLVFAQSAAQRGEPALRRSTQWAAGVALAASTLAAGYVGWSLLRVVRPSGTEEARDFLRSRIRPLDYVIDRSDQRLAFVAGNWLVKPDDVPASIGGELYDNAWGGGPVTQAPRLAWLITKRGREETLRVNFRELGRPVESQSIGDFHIDAIEPHRMRLLKLGTGDAAMNSCQVGSTNWPMISAVVSASHPVDLTLQPEALGQALLIAGGAPNHEVAYPRQPIALTLRGARENHRALKLEFPNRFGMQWRTLDTRPLAGEQRTLTVELRTNDVLPRVVCIEVLALDARGGSS